MDGLYLLRSVRRPFYGLAIFAILLALGAALSGPSGFASSPGSGVLMVNNPRVVVLKSKRQLYLFDGPQLVRSYPVDLGMKPSGEKHRDGDNRTPEGRFRICSKNDSSGYHRFLGIDYPGVEAVERGLRSGLISEGEAGRIRSALAESSPPPWDTPLGGGVGLHGHGRGVDWTAGCVALSDAAIEELFGLLRLGDEVEILP